MSTEYWATFSIYDHRSPVYRRALVVFDRVVVPVATRPFGRLTEPELDRLTAEVDYLVSQGRAVRFDWDPEEFEDWKRDVAGKAVANYLGHHPELDTRYQLQYEVERGAAGLADSAERDVLAVPVYGSPASFEGDDEERQVLEVILDALPVPDADAPLEAICELRDREDFATSLRKMRIWQDDLVLDLVRAGSDREREILVRQARARLEDWLQTYRRLLQDADLARNAATVTAITSLGRDVVGAAGGLPRLLGALGGAARIRTVRRPSWRTVAELECAPAGLIYGAERALAG